MKPASSSFRHPIPTRYQFQLLVWLGLVLAALSSGFPAAGAPVTTATLLEEMTDLAGLSKFPAPAFTCRQFSSYDRAAKSPAENWFANGDCGHYLRIEDREGRKEHVLMDVAGPGAIVRIWSANPAGTLRIYIDGDPEPVLEAPMTELLGGSYPGLPRPIAGEYSKGWNLYFPIAYAKQCKVTSDKGGFYYHVNYRTYPAGTVVTSFHPTQLRELGTALEKLGPRLGSSQPIDAEMSGEETPFDFSIPPSDSIREEIPGPKAISRIKLRVSADDLETALRGVLVRISFDGQPCVETPLGDFFGTAPGINPYSSLPLGMTAKGEMYSRWLMPFRSSAVIELVNSTRQSVRVTGTLELQDYVWTDRSMHFHAKWRAQFDVPARPMQDWNYLTARGQGVFVGAAFAIDNPVKDWWGEGDEKIYVDGETFPSHFGTGTEDYFGYAWCSPALFSQPYHAQPRCDGPGNYGRTSVNRFHILDRIPFTRDFRFDMELWHWNEKCKVNMAVTAYWYSRPEASDGFKPIAFSDAVVRPMPAYVVPKVSGAIEGEALPVLRVTGTANPQDWDGLSAGRHLWWHAGMKPGDQLVIGFAVPKPGRYRVVARFLTARDYGVHQLAINGVKAGEPIDFYAAQVTPSRERDLGVFDLKPENNEFSATVVGANAKAVPAYMFGLDYLLLKPVR